jgi:hypothetical protein
VGSAAAPSINKNFQQQHRHVSATDSMCRPASTSRTAGRYPVPCRAVTDLLLATLASRPPAPTPSNHRPRIKALNLLPIDCGQRRCRHYPYLIVIRSARSLLPRPCPLDVTNQPRVCFLSGALKLLEVVRQLPVSDSIHPARAVDTQVTTPGFFQHHRPFMHDGLLSPH